MLTTLTPNEVRDWQLFDQLEPLGPRESREHLAMMVAMLHNRWRKKDAPIVAAKDLLIGPPPDPAEEAAAASAKKRAMIDTLRALGRPASERPKHRKHPKELKIRAARARKGKGK